MSTELATLAARTYAALVHYPVYDRRGEVVTTAVTNLDIHDIARSTRTYGLAGYYLVTPIQLQQDMIGRILGHWQDGPGKAVHPDRAEALDRVKVMPSLAQMRADIAARHGGVACETTATAAKQRGDNAVKTIGYTAWQGTAGASAAPQLVLFGTGWGLTTELLGQCDRILLPIQGKSDYNHLSVRSAVAVTLDRLFADRAGDA